MMHLQRAPFSSILKVNFSAEDEVGVFNIFFDRLDLAPSESSCRSLYKKMVCTSRNGSAI